MSLLYNVLFATKCRSNHHRLALDGLRWLNGDDAEKWRNLFLHHYEAYLEGAKAPDDVFKDFKNHVLHVRDNYWGGATEAAQEWYRRSVRAFAAKDWKLGVYSAGVMSHYVVDPIQPFHTGQTEEEGVIHRAVEQSLSKAYGLLQELLEHELGGYPTDLALPDGADWLAETVRQGAAASNPHYETLIDHYNFARGAKKPLEGLDDTIDRAIAPLIGRAAVTLARIYERAFEEAAVSPPNVITSLDAVFATLQAPISAITNKLASDRERALVKAMYEEFQKSGKVRATLPADDREVRALYAMEVLQTPLSALNAKWPREIGLAHGADAEEAPATPRQKSKPDSRPQPAPKAEIAPPAHAAPTRESTPEQTDASAPQPRLHREDPIVEAPSIGAKTAARLEAIGMRTIADLLEAEPESAAKSVRASHITPPVIRDWQAQAGLACAIPALRSFDAQVLVACGVRDLASLAQQSPGALLNAINAYLKTKEGQQLARSSKPADVNTIAGWIEAAGGMADSARSDAA